MPSKEVLRADDHLIISGRLEDLLKVMDLRSIGLRADLRVRDARRARPHAGRGLRPAHLRSGGTLGAKHPACRSLWVLLLGVHRHPTLRSAGTELDLLATGGGARSVKDLPVAAGDVLLVSGPPERIREFAQDEEATLLSTIEYQRPRYRRAAIAIVIFGITVVAAGMRLTSPAIAGLTGMIAMIATGCVPPRAAFSVDWRVVIMIGALLTLGHAMEQSGTGEFLADGVLSFSSALGPRGVLIVLMVGTVILSIPMSNQAAALILLPVGVHAAVRMGVSPRTFAVGICLAASCSFVTPFEPSAALVYGPGRYRFSDFLRVGGPLTALMLLVLSFGVPWIWPFGAR